MSRQPAFLLAGRVTGQSPHNPRMTATPSPTPGTYAAIDLGSNSFRLETAELAAGRYQRLEYLKETVRLGAGLDAQGLLTEAAMQAALDCLQRYAQRLQGVSPQRIRAVATQTLREARNRETFLARAQAALGVPIDVISGHEEARLIYAGVARLQPSQERRLVVDIGGRSTEMILGEGAVPLRMASYRVGSVSLSLRYFADGRFTEAAFRAAQAAAGDVLEAALQPFAASHWREALGSSGTSGAVSQLLAAHGITDGTITLDGLHWCMAQCLRAGHAERIDLAGLEPNRRAVIGGGLATLLALLTRFDIAALKPARGALRHGVIFELDERLRATTDAATPAG